MRVSFISISWITHKLWMVLRWFKVWENRKCHRKIHFHRVDLCEVERHLANFALNRYHGAFHQTLHSPSLESYNLVIFVVLEKGKIGLYPLLEEFKFSPHPDFIFLLMKWRLNRSRRASFLGYKNKWRFQFCIQCCEELHQCQRGTGTSRWSKNKWINRSLCSSAASHFANIRTQF